MELIWISRNTYFMHAITKGDLSIQSTHLNSINIATLIEITIVIHPTSILLPSPSAKQLLSLSLLQLLQTFL